MARSIGGVVTDHLTLGVVEGNQVRGGVFRYPDNGETDAIRARCRPMIWFASRPMN